MDLQELKTAIIKQIDELQSEKALLEVERFLHVLENGKTTELGLIAKADSVEKADEVFAKAVERYHTVLHKLAQ
jgi:hypothetical protein